MTEEKVFVVWFKNGTTAMFQGVVAKMNGGADIVFYYTSDSRGQRMRGSFHKEKIAGYAVSDNLVK